MYNPSLGWSKPTDEINEQHDIISAPRAQRTSRARILRRLLLGWACLRLVVSLTWTTVILITVLAPFLPPRPSEIQPGRLAFDTGAIILQLVEFGMICTFIAAGIKKSFSLYRAYYYYCILTLIIYITAVMLSLVLSYENGHYFTEIYLTYHITDGGLMFVFAVLLDIGLEVLLIASVRFLMKEYSSNQNYAVPLLDCARPMESSNNLRP